jgi:hypothetical protein
MSHHPGLSAPPPHITLDTLLTRNANEIATINTYDGPLLPLIDDEPIVGNIYHALLEKNKLESITPFPLHTLTSLFQSM